MNPFNDTADLWFHKELVLPGKDCRDARSSRLKSREPQSTDCQLNIDEKAWTIFYASLIGRHRLFDPWGRILVERLFARYRCLIEPQQGEAMPYLARMVRRPASQTILLGNVYDL